MFHLQMVGLQTPNQTLNQLDALTSEHVMPVFVDQLHDDWQVNSTASFDLAASAVMTGEEGFSISVEFVNGWDTLDLQHNAPIGLDKYDTVGFWLKRWRGWRAATLVEGYLS